MGRKLIVSIGVILAMIFLSYPILATAITPVVIEKDGQDRPTIIIEEGRGKDTGLVKVTQIHYAKGNAQSSKGTPCYKLAGWKWTTPVKYTINRADYSTFNSPVTNAQNAWDDKTTKTMFDSPTTGVTRWYEYSDGTNSILFGNFATANVIAVTRTWYNRATKVAVESDILFDTDFKWGDATTNPAVMDIQNIATHEIGHTLGLSDVYGSCTVVTMYGYSSEGDVSKRTLELPDITGFLKIYPNI